MDILQMQNEVLSTNEAKVAILLPSTINYIKLHQEWICISENSTVVSSLWVFSSSTGLGLALDMAKNYDFAGSHQRIAEPRQLLEKLIFVPLRNMPQQEQIKWITNKT